MSAQVRISLHSDRLAYWPEDLLAGEYQVVAADPAEIDAVELSVLWHTEGTGDEDLHVQFFERVTVADVPAQELLQPRRFGARLPKSPLSYDGLIVKIRWCVRARAFFQRGKEALAECPFTLGCVPAAVPVEQP